MLPKFFLAQDNIDIDRFNLKAWPGYEVAAKCSIQGIFFNVDSCTKFMQKDTILTQFKNEMEYGMRESDFFGKYDSSNTEIPRKTVMCEHNTKSYQVDGMTYEMTPQTYKF